MDTWDPVHPGLQLYKFYVLSVVPLKLADVGAMNRRMFCAVCCNKKAGLEVIHGLLDRTMLLLECTFDKKNGYSLRPSDGNYPCVNEDTV